MKVHIKGVLLLLVFACSEAQDSLASSSKASKAGNRALADGRGACRFQNRRCKFTKEPRCINKLSGKFMGIGVRCPPQKGACCLPDGRCMDKKKGKCERKFKGEFMGHNVSCSNDRFGFPIQCPVLPGACCLDEGKCVDTSFRQCDMSHKGVFKGHGVSCSSGVSCDFALTPTPIPPTEFIRKELRTKLAPLSGDALSETGTPQNDALNWLAVEDPLRTNTPFANLKFLRDRYALTVLFFATQGPSWYKNSGFLTERSVCGWNDGINGVFCSGSFVHKISLPNNNLQGTLPREISILSGLKTIELWNNSLTGPIRPVFGDLAQLERLDMYDNKLTGTIPRTIAALPALKIAQLQRNRFSGPLPPFTGDQISEVWAQGNNLTGTLDDFFAFSSETITLVRAGENQISGVLPASIGNFTDLNGLGLTTNKLAGTIPSTIGKLLKLEQLDLSFNMFNGTIPPEFGRLNKLYGLGLGSNKLFGTLPVEMENCVALSLLDLHFCGLSGSFPASVANLPDLEFLTLHGNSFSNNYTEDFCERENLIDVLSQNCPDFAVDCSCCTHCCTEFECERLIRNNASP